MKKIMSIVVLAALLATIGCGPSSEIEAILPLIAPAAVTAVEFYGIASGHPVDPSVVAKINADSQNAQNLYLAWANASAAAKPDAMNQLIAAVGAAQANLTTLFATFQVSDPKSQAKMAALTGLVLGELGSLQAILAAAQKPHSAVAHATVQVVSVGHAPSSAPMSAREFKKAVNAAAGKKAL